MAQAREFVLGVRDVPLAMIEQPVRADQVQGMAELRALSSSPLSADEAVCSVSDALRLVEVRAADVFSVKVSKNGGVAPARDIACIAAAAGVSVVMNSMLEHGITQAASLQLCATLPNLADHGHSYMSTLRMADDFTTFGSLVKDGVATVPANAPGLGIDVDEPKLRGYTRRAWVG